MANKDRLPNVLLIIVDALRPDRLHCYGNPWPTSPAIDRLAADGVLFRQMIAHSSHTLPCMGSIFTGLDPMSHGLTDPRTHVRHSWGNWKPPFGILGERGCAIGGFDAFLFFHFGRHPQVENSKEAAGFLEEHRGGPFFLWQFLDQVHLPYDPPPPYDTAFLPPGYRISPDSAKRVNVVRSTMIVHRPGLVSQFELDQVHGRENSFEADADRQIDYKRSAGVVELQDDDRIPITALYDGEVRTLDDQVAEYVAKLDQLGILDDTIVMLTADHGEELMERGNVGHSSCSLAGSLYDEAIRVPFIIRYPRRLPRGRVVEAQVPQMDIMPTVFDILGLPMPVEADGRSFLPLIDDPREAGRAEVFAETLPCGWQALKDDRRRIWCVRTPKWKLVHHQCEPQAGGRYELFDLERDPGETSNVLEQNPRVAEALKRKLCGWMHKQPMRPLA